MSYSYIDDVHAIQEILGITQEELATKLGVQSVTISRNLHSKNKPSLRLLEDTYNFAFESGIRLGKLKEMLWRESMQPGHKLLLHGAKSEIEGDLSIAKSRVKNDFGQGFYTGESYDQAVSFVSGFENSSVYYLDFEDKDLKCKKYEVNQEWMLTIAYFRQTLEGYEEHPLIQKMVTDVKECDYVIAPIADNRMFQIINSFINGEITDEQCKHCLAATNLGNQYVFTSEKALQCLKIVEHSYISKKEKEYYQNIRSEETRLGDDKVKMARRQFRGQGLYIDEILK